MEIMLTAFKSNIKGLFIFIIQEGGGPEGCVTLTLKRVA
jgi:hypothetical protein